MRKKWEYKVEQCFVDSIVTDVNECYRELGEQEWELVSVTQYKPSPKDNIEIANWGYEVNSMFTAFFKREIID